MIFMQPMKLASAPAEVTWAATIRDYRWISLILRIEKLISKILVHRLAPSLNSLVLSS
jgi:hypothetical protein